MLEDKLQNLKSLLLAMDGAVVAYSGGVDSAFLACVAAETLGDRALAVTARSPSYPAVELAQAAALARERGMRHRLVDTGEVARAEYSANGPDRCYFCKQTLFLTLEPIAREEGLSQILLGAIAEDLQDYRPGHRAALEAGVRAPLAEAGLSKAEVRELSRRMGLPTWDKPASACLASRVRYGLPIDAKVLGTIEAAEGFLLGLGFRELRVRHEGPTARLELPLADLARVLEHREAIVAHLKSLGYVYVSLDLEGFRSGSGNLLLQRGAAPAAPGH